MQETTYHSVLVVGLQSFIKNQKGSWHISVMSKFGMMHAACEEQGHPLWKVHVDKFRVPDPTRNSA